MKMHGRFIILPQFLGANIFQTSLFLAPIQFLIVDESESVGLQLQGLLNV